MRIIFVRHGEPDYRTDSLTENGIKEAEALAKRASDWNVKDIFVSPLGRAAETAAPTLAALNREAVTLPWLREFSYQIISPAHGEKSVPWDFTPGFLFSDERLTSLDEWMNVKPLCDNEDILKNYPIVIDSLDKLIESYGYVRCGKYYKRKDGRERFIERTVTDGKIPSVDLLEEGDSEPTILMFCHLGVICLMLSRLTNIPFELLTHGFYLAPTSLTIVNTEERWSDEVSFRIQVMGDVTHLHKEGIHVSNAGSFAQIFQK